ncbi:MAG TPA: ABC transporter permease [Casimicrobiaceae bacterium]|nr:ABC transporter permease [Casimicrobiaceae bacterium]
MTASAVVSQLANGLASASALFLVAAGLTLIFGVTRVVNFAHGSLAMLGAYVAASVVASQSGGSASFWLGALAAVAVGALLGIVLERGLVARLYAAPEMLQLTATFGVVLIVRDVALALFGAEDRLGPRVPGLSGSVDFGAFVIPQYDLALAAVGPVVLVMLTLVTTRTRFGVVVRACAENRTLAAALGIDPVRVNVAVFALGGALATLAGALALPRAPATLSMDLPIVADAFVVTVMGGLGSIPGAFVAALAIAIVKALCIGAGRVEWAGVAIDFPKLTLVAEFVVMAAVLVARPQGLFGRVAAVPATTPLPEQRAWQLPLGRRDSWLALALCAIIAIGPALGDEYARVLGTEILIAALFAASLQLLLGTGGMTSFGHAAHFGIGAYAGALAAKAGWGFAAALGSGIVAGAASAALIGALAVRLSGVYLAMLTLAFAEIAWSIAWQWDSVTGGSNGLIGVWPPAPLASATAYYALTATIAVAALAALVALARSPWGFALRAARDAEMRAAAVGIDVTRTRWLAFVAAGAFAGLAGVLFAFSKGSLSPETLAIPKSVDAIVMVLLGGLNAWFGPLAGAAAYTWLQDLLARSFPYWRAALGVFIIALVIAFPAGIAGALRWRPRARNA